MRNDLTLWYPKVRRGGVIAGTAYGVANHAGVQKAVDSFFPPLNLRVHVEPPGVWWVQKNV
jgi:hypothetical protein